MSRRASRGCCATRPGRRGCLRWLRRRSPRCSGAPWKSPRRARRPTGPCGRWPGRAGCRRPKCIRSGRRPAWRRTATGASSCPAIRPFAAKVEDVVGLYVDPPKHAIVLSIDEKSQIQALDRTVIGRNMQRHRHQEFIRFLHAVEREVPAGKVIHVVLDNYAAHKHPNVRKWLARHPRWTFHFTPTSCSWLNAVEGFFAKLTRRRLKRGVFPSLVALQEAIRRFIDHHNQESMPFTWKADPKNIIAAAKRGHQTLETIH